MPFWGKLYKFLKKSVYFDFAAAMLIGYANPLSDRGCFCFRNYIFSFNNCYCFCSLCFDVVDCTSNYKIRCGCIFFSKTKSSWIIKIRTGLKKGIGPRFRGSMKSKNTFYLFVDRKKVEAKSGVVMFYIPKSRLSKETMQLFKSKRKALLTKWFCLYTIYPVSKKPV